MAGQTATASSRYVPGQVIVVFKPKTTFFSTKKIVRMAGARPMKNLRLNKIRIRLIKVAPGKESKTITYLKHNPRVQAASLNHVTRVAWGPNDPYYALGSLGSLQWNFSRINIANAWDFNRGAGASVAVLDTGLADNLTDIDYTNVLQGYDFINDDKKPTDDHGHGSHVTGTIAAASDNNIGTAGIAPEANILPVKVLNNNGEGSDINLIQGLLYAYEKNANVVNMSISLGSPSLALKAVLDAIVSDGIPVFIAAGNDGTGVVSYPARHGSAISVAATDYNNAKASYSNYGDGLDISAPGGDSAQDLNGDGYGDGILQETIANQDGLAGPSSGFYLFSGTSMATAHASGVAALLHSQGVRGARHIKEAITKTATDLGAAGYDTTFGHGLINAANALNFPKSLLSIKVSKVRASYNQAVRVYGTLLPARTANVFIQTYDDVKGKWSNVKTIATDSNGNYAANIRLIRNSYVRVDWNGGDAILGQTSGSKQILVKAKVGLKSSVKRISAGSGFTLSGKVAPRHRGAIIYIQRKVGKRWKSISSTRLNNQSVFKKVLKPGQTGLLVLRAYINHEHHLPTASKQIAIRVLY